MTREIKFRGLRTNGRSIWVYGYYFFDRDVLQSYIIDDVTNVDVFSDSVGQFTGRKDKNGVDIYEGDRVNYFGATGVVIYEPETAMYMVKFDFPMVSLYSFDNIDDSLEVISNIHEKEDQQ